MKVAITITTSQLDELERRAKAAMPGPWEHITEAREPGLGHEHTIRQTREASMPPYPQHGICRTFEWSVGGADARHIAANSPDVTLRLVAIARAALALDQLACDPRECSGWHHTMACQGRRSEAERGIRNALRGTP